MKIFWKFIYTFNRVVLFWIPGVTIGNSKLYEAGDEYVTLRADMWVVVKSKTDKNSTDMIPIYLVSEDCVKILIKSVFFNANEIINNGFKGLK